MVQITMRNGTVLEIHDSAWGKFFDVRIEGDKQQDNTKNYPTLQLILAFGIPEEKSIGEKPQGSMLMTKEHGKITLR
jgi:hypothetical protein